MRQKFAWTGPTPTEPGKVAQYIQIFTGEGGKHVIRLRDENGTEAAVEMSAVEFAHNFGQGL